MEEEIKLTHEQEEALDRCTSSQKRVFIITGKPGTGKTTLALWIVDHFSQSEHVALCAPTGRAAKRLSEKTGRPARTIHRLLGFNPAEGWEYNEENPLPYGVVVCDESSMIDIFLMRRLLAALSNNALLILSGDPYQLPPVGPGAPFRDLIHSRKVPYYELQKIHRQSADNMIVLAAHAILEGRWQDISWDGERKDLQLRAFDAEADPADIISEIEVELFNVSNIYAGVKYSDTQVLCPQKKGDIGTKALNQRFQEAFNPASLDKYEYSGTNYTFREGDKIIQMKNDYSLGVFNGDIGIVEQVYRKDDKEFSRGYVMRVRFDDLSETKELKPGHVNQLALAYALTIHKSQGSEYPLVIIPCHRSNHWMWTRPLLYTALTRAKQHCLLVGDLSLVTKAIRDTREDKRATYLKERILS